MVDLSVIRAIYFVLCFPPCTFYCNNRRSRIYGPIYAAGLLTISLLELSIHFDWSKLEFFHLYLSWAHISFFSLSLSFHVGTPSVARRVERRDTQLNIHSGNWSIYLPSLCRQTSDGSVCERESYLWEAMSITFSPLSFLPFKSSKHVKYTSKFIFNASGPDAETVQLAR